MKVNKIVNLGQTAVSVQDELVLGCLSCLCHFSAVFQGPQDSKGTGGSLGHTQPTVHLLRGDGSWGSW